MGFLHLGWDIAAKEGASDHMLGDYNSAWGEVAKHVDLSRPGMAAVIRTMGWQPLHLAAMEGKVGLVKMLVQQLGCNILGRSANSWTPMHYAAAHNQVRKAVSISCGVPTYGTFLQAGKVSMVRPLNNTHFQQCLFVLRMQNVAAGGCFLGCNNGGATWRCTTTSLCHCKTAICGL